MPARRSLRIHTASTATEPARGINHGPPKARTLPIPRSSTIASVQAPKLPLSPLAKAIAKINLELIVSSQHPPVRSNSVELTAIPATCFPKFKTLPNELQHMIWTFAIKDPLIVAIIPKNTGRFVASSSKAAILAFSKFDPTKFPLFPVYLPPNPSWDGHQKNKRNLSIQSGEGQLPQVEPIFLLSRDILYMPEIYKLDAYLFLAREENQILERLAIHASTALRLGGDDRHWSEEGKILRNLRNLKMVLILEGSEIGDEMQSRSSEGFFITLLDMKETPGTSVEISSNNTRQRRHQSPWVVNATTSVRAAFMEEMARNTRPGFQKPLLQFWEVQRRVIGVRQSS
ncbi:hypothetical protein BKA65DRAFT_509924 [Rhexocercosporidium sp. MPI-PUGE-AT-0058]|nr:hypothetical protein BKA65DRAFT_509924 [Rhexocercosporidium sp. MPI-PUGE-AT-0058]